MLHKISLLFAVIASCLVTALTPAVAYATVAGDQTPLTDEEIQTALDAGLIGPNPNEPSVANAESSSFVEEFSGETRFDTAALQAMRAYSSSHYVIVIGDGAWPDALSATGLAGLLDCPILVTARDSLSPAAADAIQTLGASHAVVLGGEMRITTEVITDLQDLGIQVDRLAGETRQDTQMMVYEYGLNAPTGKIWSNDIVAFASGADGHFHDALSFSPVAYSNAVPVFLLDNSGNLNNEQKSVLLDRKRASVITLGGQIVCSNDTIDYANSISMSGRAIRLAGDTRYDTSALVADWSVRNMGFSWDKAAFSTASLPYDALAGSVLQGKEKSVILLVDSGSNSTVKTAANNKSSVSSIRFFGGTLSISNGTRLAILRAFGHKFSDLPSYKVYLDAGHGGNDPGAISGGNQESKLTTDLAYRVGRILEEQYGIACYINDKGIDYRLRQADAVSRGCTTLVSLHFNAGGGSGTESYRHSVNPAESAYELQCAIHPHLVSGVGLKDRGMKAEQFAVVSWRLPSTLLEVCFIDNLHDMAVYHANIDRIASEIAAGIASA